MKKLTVHFKDAIRRPAFWGLVALDIALLFVNLGKHF